MRILVVEDEGHVADLILEALEARGHECLVAKSAEEADRLIAAGGVDGITLDVRIPGRSGLAWLCALSAARPELARRTIVVTGAPLTPEDCHDLARCGASMLAKPFSVDDLLETVSKHLSPIHLQPPTRD